MSCNSQLPLAAQVRQSSGWSEMYSSMTPRRRRNKASLSVVTCMPSSASVVQEDGKPRRSFDLHHAQAAGAEGFQMLGGAQSGDVDAGLGSGMHDRGAGRHADRHAVDGQCHILG
jgi:hypothetical protein